MKKKKTKEARTKPGSPLEVFFKLAPKDPVRKALFDYCLMWIIFLGFAYILLTNLNNFILLHNFSSGGWCLVMGGILYFNYGALVGMRANYKLIKKMANTKPDKNIDDVMGLYDEKSKKTKGGKQDGNKKV